MTRTFYVDAARAKNNKKYWKCSVVERTTEGKENVANFFNGKAHYSIEAEAYGILSTVFWLIEQKEQGKVTIYSDCRPLTRNKFKDIKRRKKLLAKGKYFSRAMEFLELAKEITKKNGILLTIGWVKGVKNLADYYSRH